jgi:hypothetical protein
MQLVLNRVNPEINLNEVLDLTLQIILPRQFKVLCMGKSLYLDGRRESYQTLTHITAN